LGVQGELSDESASLLISRECGRDVSVVLWGGNRDLAFEVAGGDTPLLKCIVRAERKSGGLVALSAPFLVEIPRGEIDLMELRSSVESRLSAIWVGASGADRKLLDGLAEAEWVGEGRFGVFVTASEPHDLNSLRSTVQKVTPIYGRVCGEECTVVLRTLDEGVNVGVLTRNRELPVLNMGSYTLHDCLEFFAQRETLDENNPWICERCNEIVFPDKKVDIWSVPEVFIVHLKRFRGGYGVRLSKLDDFIEYPPEIDMAKYVVGPQKETEQRYRLYEVSNHYGGLGGGHYTANAIVQNPFGEADLNAPWYLFDDSSVSKSGRDYCTAAGYVLFYEKIR
jgi:hypothetical protein